MLRERIETENGSGAPAAPRHIPVLLAETMEALAVRPGGRYIDGTLGRAGHAAEIVRRGGRVLGIDRDAQALAEVDAKKIDGLEICKGNHGNLAEIAHARGWNNVDGILLDLGVSSPQLDEADRGFSFMREGPLDMRMDRESGLTAADLVNSASAERLEEAFREYGEEPGARRIAKAIVEERVPRPFRTTTELALFVERLVGRHGSRHGATRVFQALRMAVNDELGELERALGGGLEILARGGRFAVITFESISDRTVKRFFARHAGKMVSLQQGGEEWRGEEPCVRLVARHAIAAGAGEIAGNPRARSAKLRCAEKI